MRASHRGRDRGSTRRRDLRAVAKRERRDPARSGGSRRTCRGRSARRRARSSGGRGCRLRSRRPVRRSAASGTPSASRREPTRDDELGRRSAYRMPGVICTPKLAQDAADLADRAAGAQRLAHRRQEVRVGLGDAAHLGERRVGRLARLAPPGRAPCARAGVARSRDRPGGARRAPSSSSANAVDADDDALARLDLAPGSGTPTPRSRPGRTPARSPRPRRRARRSAAISSLRPLLELVRQRLDEVRAAERVRRVGRARLVREDLLRAQRDPRRALGRQRERLVERVRVQRLRAAADRRERLDRDAHDVVLRLLRGERRAAGLRVEAERVRARVRRAEPVAHDRRPTAAARRGTSRPPGRSGCAR